MVAAPECLGQAWFWAARQEGDPAGIPSGVGAWRLQPTLLRVWLCRPSRFAQTGAPCRTSFSWTRKRRTPAVRKVVAHRFIAIAFYIIEIFLLIITKWLNLLAIELSNSHVLESILL